MAAGSAVVCGWPDGIFGSGEHILLAAAVLAVGIAASAATGVHRAQTR